MSDSISAWIVKAAVRYDDFHGTLIASEVHDGGQVQLLRFTSNPTEGDDVWVELSDKEISIPALIPRSEIKEFHNNNNERFTEQQYSLFTIEKFTWLVDRPMQPVRVVGPSSSNARCQWTPADNPRVCLKVVSLKLLGGSDGPIYKDGQRLQHLEQSNTTAAWAQGCSDRAMENVREFDRERKKRRGLPSSPVALQKQGTKPPLGPVDTGLEKPAFRRTKEDMTHLHGRGYVTPQIELKSVTSQMKSINFATALNTARNRTHLILPPRKTTATAIEAPPSAPPQRSTRLSPLPTLPTGPPIRRPASHASNPPPPPVCASSTSNLSASNPRRTTSRPSLKPTPPIASPPPAASHPTPALTPAPTCPLTGQAYEYSFTCNDIPAGTATTVNEEPLEILSQYPDQPPARQGGRRWDNSVPEQEEEEEEEMVGESSSPARGPLAPEDAGSSENGDLEWEESPEKKGSQRGWEEGEESEDEKWEGEEEDGVEDTRSRRTTVSVKPEDDDDADMLDLALKEEEVQEEQEEPSDDEEEMEVEEHLLRGRSSSSGGREVGPLAVNEEEHHAANEEEHLSANEEESEALVSLEAPLSPEAPGPFAFAFEVDASQDFGATQLLSPTSLRALTSPVAVALPEPLSDPFVPQTQEPLNQLGLPVDPQTLSPIRPHHSQTAASRAAVAAASQSQPRPPSQSQPHPLSQPQTLASPVFIPVPQAEEDAGVAARRQARRLRAQNRPSFEEWMRDKMRTGTPFMSGVAARKKAGLF